MMVQNGATVADNGKITLDTFSAKWYEPNRIIERLMQLFTNSACDIIDQFSFHAGNEKILRNAEDYEDVVFFTFAEEQAYTELDRLFYRY